MKTRSRIAAWQRLRQQPTWKLLAADNAPLIAALLQALLLDADVSCRSRSCTSGWRASWRSCDVHEHFPAFNRECLVIPNPESRIPDPG